jgi:hypothetical protein
MEWTEEEINAKLPKDPTKAAIFLCQIIQQYRDVRKQKDNWLNVVMQTFAFLVVWIDKNSLGGKDLIPDLSKINQSNAFATIATFATKLEAYYDKAMAQNTLETAIQTYKAQLGVGFSYQLTEGDLKRIQDLITKLRQQIASSQVLGEEHKRRLLSRLEKLQSELHKRMSDYDRVYGLLIDGIILVQKFGDAVKPITELLREIGKLFWISQIRGEELPGDSPLPLPPAPKQTEDR